jgi:hypothetical protein
LNYTFQEKQNQRIDKHDNKGDHQDTEERPDSEQQSRISLRKGKDAAQVSVMVQNILKG